MTPRQATIETRPEKRDHRQEVTDSIIKMLEDGVAPWQKPWESRACRLIRRRIGHTAAAMPFT